MTFGAAWFIGWLVLYLALDVLWPGLSLPVRVVIAVVMGLVVYLIADRLIRRGRET